MAPLTIFPREFVFNVAGIHLLLLIILEGARSSTGLCVDVSSGGII